MEALLAVVGNIWDAITGTISCFNRLTSSFKLRFSLSSSFSRSAVTARS